MHYHLEIIMPPVGDIRASVAEIMEPLRERRWLTDECVEVRSSGFWDYYEIGGRYVRRKLRALFGTERMDAFDADLVAMRPTIDPVICGLERLSPASQELAVDALWRKHFPDSPIPRCPWFANFYDHRRPDAWPAVIRIDEIPESLDAFRVIIAEPDEERCGRLFASDMFAKQVDNGVSTQDTGWDGRINGVLEGHWRPKLITGDWLCVTVDYHS